MVKVKVKVKLEIPKFEDDPEWCAEAAKLRDLAQRCGDAEAREKRVRQEMMRESYLHPQPRYGETPSPIETAFGRLKEATVAALLDDKPLPPSPATAADLDRLEFESATLREAVARQNEKVQRIEDRLKAAVVEKYRPVDRENVDRVVAALEDLLDALAITAELRSSLARTGIHPSTYPNTAMLSGALGRRDQCHHPAASFLRQQRAR